jgi:YidC/Oxa1 family membrane protein insertase
LASWFSFISTPMESALVQLALFVGSAGIAIILFTIIIRLILSPLQIVQLRSARAMQRLQPHIAELRKKHGKDKQKLTEGTMKLYKEHKVNPAMGCLPMIIQFPILIGLFWALRHLGDSPGNVVLNSKVLFNSWLKHSYHYDATVYNLYHAKFLWLSNGLGKPDPLYILPVLAGVTQWIQSRMMMQKSSDPQQQTMNMMMNFTPLIIVFFAANYASGLSLYWVTSTIIGIILSAKITGWGSLPRFDRMLFPNRAPAQSFVSTKKKPSPKPVPSTNGTKADSGDVPNGKHTAAEPTVSELTLADGEVDGSGENGAPATNGSQKEQAPENGTSQPGQKRSNYRRRQGRPRGGKQS